MSFDPTELLIREAVTYEADRAVDPRTVVDELRHGKVRTIRRRTPLVLAAAALVVVAAVAAVVVPQMIHREVAVVGAAAAPVDQNVLLVGLDDRGNPDSIVLAHFGKDGTASAVSLPRDSWVDVPGDGMRKLNSTYAAGPGKLVATVQELTGVTVDHYAIVDMSAFDRLSTAIGGVPVCLRAASHDTYSGASFPAGRQTLSGASALAFLRQRHGLPQGDLDRVVRLQAFLRSLAHQVLSGSTLTDEKALTSLLDTVRDTVRVDPDWDLLAFAAQLRGLRTDDLQVGTVPITNTALRTSDSGAAIEVAPDQVRSYVQGLTNGTPTGGSTLPAGDTPCVN